MEFWYKITNHALPYFQNETLIRDLKAFNFTHLAKQGWRLLQNTNFLFHHVFQAKYFTSWSFLDAQISKRPSYAWRSIMAAKSVVEEGIRWSIGNSESVQIWKDKLVPKPDKITTPINPLLYNEKVSAVIDKERAMWKTKMINSFFLPYDAESILAIPLSSTSPVDQRVWSATATAIGVFSVCSAYQISHKQLTKVDVGECLSNTRMISLWKSVWKLCCPNKIKNFIWWACKDILPTKTKLKDCKIPMEVECDICGEVETARHVF